MCEKYCCDQPSVSPLAVFVVNPISHGVLWSQKCWAFIPKLFVTTISLWCVNFSGTKARKKSPRTMQHIIFHFLELLGCNWPEVKNIWPYSQLYLSYWYFNVKSKKNVIVGCSKTRIWYERWIRIRNCPIFRSDNWTIELGLFGLSSSKLNKMHSRLKVCFQIEVMVSTCKLLKFKYQYYYKSQLLF